MKNERILLANIKCHGCATTIKSELLKLREVHFVDVDVENDAILISYDDLSRDAIIKRLLTMGYPEATEKNGLLLQLKSYASCVIGRAHNLTQTE